MSGSSLLIESIVEPPIVDPPIKGQCMLDVSIKDIAKGPENCSAYSSNTLLRRGQPLYKDKTVLLFSKCHLMYNNYYFKKHLEYEDVKGRNVNPRNFHFHCH